MEVDVAQRRGARACRAADARPGVRGPPWRGFGPATEASRRAWYSGAVGSARGGWVLDRRSSRSTRGERRGRSTEARASGESEPHGSTGRLARTDERTNASGFWCSQRARTIRTRLDEARRRTAPRAGETLCTLELGELPARPGHGVGHERGPGHLPRPGSSRTRTQSLPRRSNRATTQRGTRSGPTSQSASAATTVALVACWRSLERAASRASRPAIGGEVEPAKAPRIPIWHPERPSTPVLDPRSGALSRTRPECRPSRFGTCSPHGTRLQFGSCSGACAHRTDRRRAIADAETSRPQPTHRHDPLHRPGLQGPPLRRLLRTALPDAVRDLNRSTRAAAAALPPPRCGPGPVPARPRAGPPTRRPPPCPCRP
jgi:hypothetical protein